MNTELKAKALFQAWQKTDREKALVWENLAREGTGVLDDGSVIYRNFMSKAADL